MSKSLLIVESPAKARTINKYLGSSYHVMASYGHVRDLVPKEGAVDPNNSFAMKYDVIARNEKHIDTMIKALRQCDTLYLATDPDREGEAIAWHIYELIRTRAELQDKPVKRVVFHEITKNAILDAVAKPRALCMPLVHAQQARRALDYLVGFELSPLLWKKIRRGLSAGRVQSPALRLIVERELEIEAFKPREYWTIEAKARHDGQQFTAKLIRYQDEKLSQFSITDATHAQSVAQAVRDAAKGHLVVTKIEKKQRKRHPPAPFITSTLQQEASRKLGFTAQRTMRVAQQLYEGVDISGEGTGLITYMRTDSVHLSDEAVDALRALIKTRYGATSCPSAARRFKTSAKNAQEAHEAIRPTAPDRLPECIKSALDKDQFRLYDLIWKRTIACQMTHATIDTVTVDLAAGTAGIFRATGATLAVPGFMSVYQEGQDDKQAEDDKLLPRFVQGDTVQLDKVDEKQHFTEPPPRFTEASIVKALEEHGIGRPSTYATIISTLKQREYVELEKKRFTPTDVGRVVNRFLTAHFSDYVDYHFTARLEDDLDAVARDEQAWVPLLSRFWQPFKEKVDYTEAHVKRADVTQEQLDEACPVCAKPLSIRLGRHGRFIGCSAYPDCDYTRNLQDDKDDDKAAQVTDRQCPKCQSTLLVKTGRYGKFIGCSAYPDCNHLEPLEKPEDTGVNCPSCTQGSLLKRRSRKGKLFFSCSRYPACQYAIWNRPIAEHCPRCAWPILTIKVTKSKGAERVCPQQACRFHEPAPDQEDV